MVEKPDPDSSDDYNTRTDPMASTGKELQIKTLKRVIIDFLDFLRYQVLNDKCTMEELKSIHDNIVSNIEVDATIPDIARHFNQTETNVRNHLWKLPRPKRRVYYSFTKFLNIVPKKWRKQ